MNLTQLTVLDLAGNILEVPVPSSLFELMNLEILYLHSNHLNGTMEFNMLFKLKNLLSDNNISLINSSSNNVTCPEWNLLGLNHAT